VIVAGALEQILSRLLVEDARVDGAVVQLAEGDQRRQRHAAVLAAERARLQKSEDEGCDFVGEGGIGLASEGGHLRALHGADETELRLDHAGMRLIAAELRGDGAMQLDDVLDAEIANAAVSR
jgi:hypothetical protein